MKQRSKTQGQIFLASVEVDKATGRYVDPAKNRTTVASWMSRWLATRSDLRATTRTRIEGIIANYIEPELGRIPIGNLSRLRVQEWAAELPGSPETIRKVVNVLSGALQPAVDDGRLPANPAVKLKLPKRVRAMKRYLAHDQVALLAQAVGDRSKGSEYGNNVLVLTLAYCGLRWGELAGLRVSDIDFARKRLTVQQTVVADKGYQGIEHPKDYEHRSIPIPVFLVDALRSQTRGGSGDDPVFYGSRTKIWLRNHTFRNGWFDPAATKIGLEGLTPHELRHTAASLAVSAGANVKAIQRSPQVATRQQGP